MPLPLWASRSRSHGEKRMPIITPKQKASKFKSGQRIMIETEDKITWTTINKVEDEIAHIDGVEVAATEIRAEARDGAFVWVWRH
jgi:TusA-related sulfurtransferase